MDKFTKTFSLAFILIILTACGPGQFLGPTFTPTPTITLTPTLTKTSTSTPTPTFTKTPTMTPSPTLVPLGGSEVAYIWADWNFHIKSLPKGITDILSNPSNLEIWRQPTGLLYTDGSPLVWDSFFFDNYHNTFAYFPVLVRGLVEIPNPVLYSGSAYIGGTLIYPVFEVPARGGSNFLIPQLENNNWARNGSHTIFYLRNGIPITWESNLENPVDSNEFLKRLDFAGWFNGKQVADVLEQYIGKVIIIGVDIYGDDPEYICLKQVVQGKLMNPKLSSIAVYFFFERLILPNR